ncbi:MAG: 5-formyltetrahydrofolate cyclo-ligase [Prevotella sp.]|nr:5-formyltetrahydrofolate cyclo-ligase [Prevotella sp.]
MYKSELRQHIRMMKRQFTSEQLCELSLPIISRLLSNPAMAKAQTILMYYSLDDEVNTHEVLNTLVKQGKTILLPAVINEQDMELHRYTSPTDLQGGFFNIMEPVGDIFTDYEHIDVAVVPGMSFDTRCNRLGRGKGYYDRFLPKLGNAYKIGICFDFQKLPGIPADEYDIRMDIVI